MLDEYTDELPDRTQTEDEFNALAYPWISWFTKTAIPGINASIQELAAVAVVSIYDSATVYNVPDVVIGSDGGRYPCIGAGVVDDNPVNSTSGKWGAAYGFSVADVYSIISQKNKIINGNPVVNQRGVSGNVTLTSNEYGLDRWMGGENGATFTFLNTDNVVTVAVTSGSVLQIIVGENLQTGSHILTWEGTAQARVNGGSWGNSGLTCSVTGGVDVTVEFGIGTHSLVQFENGGSASSFEHNSYSAELEKCRYYYQQYYVYLFPLNRYAGSVGYPFGVFHLTTQMRVAPAYSHNNSFSTPHTGYVTPELQGANPAYVTLRGDADVDVNTCVLATSGTIYLDAEKYL